MMQWIFTLIILQTSFTYIKGQQSGCNSLLSWQCGNGECINIGERCNGIADCTDGSDETVTECISFQCPDSKFRCTYGACIERSLECNGKQDCVDNSDELTEKCIVNIEEHLRGNCSIEQFQCRTGECIPLDNICDGRAECSDQSDETVESCASKCCPPFGFRCGYGGCIDERGRCDGQVDCIDESDENYLLCGYPKGGRPTTTTTSTPRPPRPMNPAPWAIVYPTESPEESPYGVPPPETVSTPSVQGGPDDCKIIKIPRNGWVEYESPPNDKLSYGDFVNEFTTIVYKCHENHIVEGQPTNLCHKGKWSVDVPDCVPRCSTRLISGVSIVPASCHLDNEEVRCSEPAKPGTIVRINCRNRYERVVGAKQQIISCGDNGVWTPTAQVCSPICGEESPDGTPYIVGGHVGNITSVPWHVGIYKFNGITFGYHCGGTILNARVVLSAMHCFWDPQKGKSSDTSLFRVAAGKTLLDYNAVERFRDQKFEVEWLYFEPGYSDYADNYLSDVAVLVLKTSIIFESYIGPICFPYGLEFEERTVTPGWKGRVAGWGLTSSGGKPSEVLKIVEIPVIERAKCISDSSPGFRPQITPDKFCAGLLNSAVSVCQGDSGGGLVFPQQERNRTVFYIRGVVSTGANKDNSCDSDKYTTFTNILHYEKLISTYATRYQPS